jgi:hypothetical protein
MASQFMGRKVKRRRLSMVWQVDMFRTTGFNEWDYLQSHFLRQ